MEAGHSVTVFTSNVPGTTTHEVIDGVEIHRFRSWFAPLNNPFLPGLAVKLLRYHDFDVIHCHGHFHLSTSFALFSNLFLRKPFVVTSHGATLALSGWRRGLELAFNKTVGLWTLRSVDKVIALAPSQTEILEVLGAKPDKLSVVPLWIDTEEQQSPTDSEKFRAAYGLGTRRIVLFVGRILPVKGLVHLIEAASRMETKPAVVIIGDEAPGYAGTEDALVRRVHELSLEDDIFFLGRFSKKDLSMAYAAADVFVLPSLGEGMPLTLLESMAHGKPVVTTNVPGNRDVVDHERNGLLVEARNPAQLAQSIDRLLRDSALRERLAAQALNDVKERYSSDVVLTRLLEIYRQVGHKSDREKPA